MCLGYSHIVEPYHRLVPGLTPPPKLPNDLPGEELKTADNEKEKSSRIHGWTNL